MGRDRALLLRSAGGEINDDPRGRRCPQRETALSEKRLTMETLPLPNGNEPAFIAGAYKG